MIVFLVAYPCIINPLWAYIIVAIPLFKLATYAMTSENMMLENVAAADPVRLKWKMAAVTRF